jgi:hypothetical protein
MHYRFSKPICKKPTPHFLVLERCDAAAGAIRFGYRWVVGDGKKIECGRISGLYVTSPLSVQFWPLYFIYYQQGTTIAEVIEASFIKLYFRRTLSFAMMESWLELEQILLRAVVDPSVDDSLISQ